MNVFVYRLLVDVMWRNEETMEVSEMKTYANKLWNEMSSQEREAVQRVAN